MLRLRTDAPGPGQVLARRGTRSARAIVEQPGASISIHWVPVHAGVEGNELANACAREAAQKGVCLRTRAVSLAFLRSQISSSVCGVEGRYCQKAQEGSSLRDPCPGHQTGHRGCPIGPQADSGSFFPVMLWHAMLTPFLRDRFGRVEFDTCWWCGGGRQTREHVFKEC